MMKRLFFWNVLALAAIMLPANLMAQEVIEPVDSIWIDTVAVHYNDIDEVIEIVDTVYMDEDDVIIDSVLTETGEIVADTFRLSDGEKWKRSLPQYDLKEYEWVEICYNPKYAVVTKKTGEKGYLTWLSIGTLQKLFIETWVFRSKRWQRIVSISVCSMLRWVSSGELSVSMNIS